MIQFYEHIFQMGWNHRLEKIFPIWHVALWAYILEDTQEFLTTKFQKKHLRLQDISETHHFDCGVEGLEGFFKLK